LKPDKETVQTEQPVKFRAILSPPLREAIYTFYADGRPIAEGRDKTEAVARFSTPGPHKVSVQVRVHGTEVTDSTIIRVQIIPRPSPTPTSTATSASITPTPTTPRSIQVRLTANKPHARVGETVTFTISIVPDVPNLDYQFDAGDGSPIEHGNTRTIRHTYREPSNSYTASVTLAGARSPGVAKLAIFTDNPSNPTSPSATESVPITPSPTPYSPSPTAMPTKPPFINPTPQSWGLSNVPWSYVVLIAFGLAAAALLLDRILKWFAVQPTVHLHPDWDAPQKPPENLAINYGLYFHSNLSAGRDQLQTDEASLILRKRTQ